MAQGTGGSGTGNGKGGRKGGRKGQPTTRGSGTSGGGGKTGRGEGSGSGPGPFAYEPTLGPPVEPAATERKPVDMTGFAQESTRILSEYAEKVWNYVYHKLGPCAVCAEMGPDQSETTLPEDDAVLAFDDTWFAIGIGLRNHYFEHQSFDDLHPHFVMNTAEVVVRRFRRRHASEEKRVPFCDDHETALVQDAGSFEDQVEANVDLKRTKEDLLAAFFGLTQQQQHTLVLATAGMRKLVGELTRDDVAARLGISRNTLDGRLSNARQSFRKKLGSGTGGC